MSNLFAGTPMPGRFDKVEKADLTGVQQVALRADSRDRELARRFELAEDLKREDLNATADFDIASIGQFGQEIFQQEVDEVRKLIASGDLDPVEARAKIAELKGLYGQFEQHSKAMAGRDEEALGLATDESSRAAYQKRLGIGEELSYGADDYAIQHNLAMNGVFEKGSAQKINGQWTVIDPNTGQRVPFSQVTGFADPNHFYRYGTKAVDVGTLDNWAKSEATVTAIGFKDGKWDEGRARNTYRDNILTTDDVGKTHRLQLLGTLEDRGLIAHLTDEQKRAFRDGDYTVQTTEDGQQIIVDATGKRLTAFEEIIAKGEDEFVTRSQFDYTMTDSKKGGGSSSGDTDLEGGAENIVVGGLDVPQSGAAEIASLSDPQMEEYIAKGGQMGHKLNTFVKPPTLTGSYVVPNHPNTKKITVIAAGINELGQRVAMVIGEEVVEKQSSFGPEFPPTSSVTTFEREIVIGEDMGGLGSDVYQLIRQKHPDMFKLVESQRNARFGDRVESMTPEEPQQEQTLDLSDAQKAQMERYDSLKKRRDDILNDPNPVSREGNMEVKRIEKEMDTLMNDKALGPILKRRQEEESRRLNEGIASLYGEQEEQPEDYSSLYLSDNATKEDRQTAYSSALKLAEEVGAPFPEAVAAQYAKESGFGKSTAKGNNFFGIKYNERDAKFFRDNGINVGSSGDLSTKEERDGELKEEKASFFTFDSPRDAFKAYVLFIQNNPRYSDALGSKDSKEYVKRLQEAGYATDSGYADSLINDYMNLYS